MKALTNGIQLKSSFAQMLAGVVLVMLILARGARAEDLFLSDKKDISNLGLAELYVQESPGFDEVRSTDRQRPLDLHSIRTTTLTYGIDIADCTLSERTDGCDYLAINGLPCLTNPGQPQLPMKTLTARLPRNAEVLGIEVVSGSYHQVLNSVSLATSPQPRIWMRQEDIPEQLHKRWELASLDLSTQQLDTYFPGDVATYDVGMDNDSAYIYVRFFPVQYIPQSNKAILITNAEINLYYRLPTSQAKALASTSSVDSAECVIIYPSELRSAAELLKDFHIEHENVSTSILTTEDIDATYLPVADPPFTGYAGDHAGKDKIVGYNYELARKIIYYLRDQRQHPNLKYVVLFGDGQLVPPSYYINEWAASEWYSWSSYEDWIPTDFLYTSPDYDFVPNYRVGRLPVSDADQAVSVVRKIERWYNNLSWDWFRRLFRKNKNW